MSQDQIAQFLQQGIAAARSNRPDIARGIFQQVVNADPRNEVAWAWLASIARDNRERLIFLKQLWEINPQNEFAIKGLRALGIEPGPAPQSAQPAAPPSTVPTLDEARHARVLQAADDFLRRYVPQPVDRLQIAWERRPRSRYGEQGAKRVRQVVYVGGSFAVLALVALVIWISTQVELPGSGKDRDADLVSNYISPTPIPSLTPTVGGPTPTLIPADRLAFAPTQIPTGLAPGDAYVVSSPTPIYPRPELNAERVVQSALDYYAIGNYEEAVRILSTERERALPDCYPSVVYYEALSLALGGDRDEAYEVLDWARTYIPQRPYTSCQDSVLILAGLAEVLYLEDPTSEAALDFSTQALTEDPRLIAAVVTKGRLELAQGRVPAAWQTVNQALEDKPDDTNLLLLAGEIDLASEQPLTALDYIGQALFLDPDLLPALYLRAQAYLDLAQQSTDDERRIQAFGLAAQSAQMILRYYEGDVSGYLYLARAYIGEEKADLAETALTRIIAVQDRLPESADPVVNEAFRLRGDLYYAQGRFGRAADDYETYVRRGGASDTAIMESLVDSAMRSSNFVKAEEWIGRLLTLQPANRQYQLWRTRLQVETCTLNPAELACSYSQALDTLTDPFIAGLPTDAQRADAYSYRAQGRLRTVIQRGAALSQGLRDTELHLALSDVMQALSVRQTAIDHYTRGLVLETLGDPVRAFEEYQWVDYWNAWYQYPFVDANFRTRFAAAGAVVRDQMEQAAAALEPTQTPTLESTTVASATPSPTVVAPTPTPTATPTPRATATATREPEPTRIVPDTIP